MAKKIIKKVDETPKKSLRHELIRQMLTLSTSGLGIVAALAWNEAIKEAVNVYVKPFAAKGSGLTSLLIYAIIVTILAVVVTYNLTKLLKKD